MSAALKYDYLWATPRWRKQSPQYDCVLINGFSGPEFAQIYGFFTVTLHPATYRVALVHHYCNVGCHLSSNYIQLENKDDIDYIFADIIIRAVHILPPSTYNQFFTVQDMSPDMYLRLLWLCLIAVSLNRNMIAAIGCSVPSLLISVANLSLLLCYHCLCLLFTSAMPSSGPQDENMNPDTGQNTEHKSQKRKRQLKEAREVRFKRKLVFYVVHNYSRPSKRFKKMKLSRDRSFVSKP